MSGFRDSRPYKIWRWWVPALIAWYLSQLIFDWDGRVYLIGLLVLLAVYFALVNRKRPHVSASAITNTPATPWYRSEPQEETYPDRLL